MLKMLDSTMKEKREYRANISAPGWLPGATAHGQSPLHFNVGHGMCAGASQICIL